MLIICFENSLVRDAVSILNKKVSSYFFLIFLSVSSNTITLSLLIAN
jgi:deoxyhypusine synthase